MTTTYYSRQQSSISLLSFATFLLLCISHFATAQQTLLASVSLAPAGTWTIEQLRPVSLTQATATNGLRLPSPGDFTATVVHSSSGQPLLGIEVEIVAASTTTQLLYENWTSLDAAAPPLPFFVNNRNFTDGAGRAYFPMLTAVRGCLPSGTQLVARAVFNKSAQSTIFGSANANRQVNIQVAASRSACSGRVLTVSEAAPSAALPNDGRLLERIVRVLTDYVDTATSLSLRTIAAAFVAEQQAAANATTTAATTTTTASPTSAASTTTADNSTTDANSSTTLSTTTTTTTTTATGLVAASTTVTAAPTTTFSFTAARFDASTGYALPVRALVLDTCGAPASGFVLADRAAPLPGAATTTTTTTTNAAAVAGDGGTTNTDGDATSATSASSSGSLLRSGWVAGSFLYETSATTAPVASFDWTVLTNEIEAVEGSFFLSHDVGRATITTAALANAQLVTAPRANESAMRYVCDTQTIAVNPVAVPPAVYGAPRLLANESLPIFDVRQAGSLIELLPVVGTTYDFKIIESYARGTGTFPNPAPEWLAPEKVTTTASATSSAAATAAPQQQNQRKQNTIFIDSLRTEFTRFSASLPLAAISAATLRGALKISSLDVPTTAPRGIALLSRLLAAGSTDTTPVTIVTESNVRLETVSVVLPDIDESLAIKIQFTRQNPVPVIDPTIFGGGPESPLTSLKVSFLFRQDVLFHTVEPIHTLFDDRALVQLSGSPLVLLAGSATVAAAATTVALGQQGSSATTLSPSSSQQKTAKVYSFRASNVVFPTSNDTAIVVPTQDKLFALRAAFDYMSFISLFGRKFDASVVGVTRFVTRTCISDTYTVYDVSLHPFQFRLKPMKQGPGLNFAVSTLVGNLCVIFVVVSAESLLYWLAGREVSSFPLHTMRVSKFLYAGTALAMVQSIQFTPNIAATFAAGISSFTFMLGVPVALAALALRAQLNFRAVYLFQPTKEDQKRAMLLQKQHGGTDDTLALMKNRMLIALGYKDVVDLNKADVVRNENAAANSVHLGWVGFVLQRLFLPPGHYLLSHRDHARARPVYERYRSSLESKYLWLFSVVEMLFQLLLAMSYSLDTCGYRFPVVIALHTAKLLALCVLLPLLSVMDNLIAITTSALLIAGIVFEIREEHTRSDGAYSVASVIFGLSNLLDALSAVLSSKHFVAWIIKKKQEAAERFNRIGSSELFMQLRIWCGVGLALMMVRQREAGIELQVDRRQIRQLLLRGGEDTVQQVKSEQQQLEEARERRAARRAAGATDDEINLEEEELLTVREQDLHQNAATFLFQDDDILTGEERRIRNIIQADARSASEISVGSGNSNNKKDNSNKAQSERSASGEGGRAILPKEQNLADPDVDLDLFFDQVAQQFASQGHRSARWGKRPGGVSPVYNRWGGSGSGDQSRSALQDPLVEGESERDRQRRLRVLEDPHLLDRFLKGDETALDFSVSAELHRAWIDPSLFHPERNEKVEQAYKFAEERQQKRLEQQKALAQQELMKKQQRQQQVEEIDLSNEPLLAGPPPAAAKAKQQKEANKYQPTLEDFKVQQAQMSPRELRDMLYGDAASPSMSPGRRSLAVGAGSTSPVRLTSSSSYVPAPITAPLASTTAAAAASISGSPTNQSFGSAAAAAAASSSSSPNKLTPQQQAEQNRIDREHLEQLYQLRHFYHNCSPQAQREVDEVIAPLEKRLHEQGMMSPAVAEIRAPITPNNNSHPSLGGGSSSSSFSNAARLRIDETLPQGRNSKRLLAMQKDPSLYIPAFTWQDEEQQKRFERANALHPMLTSALHPSGGKFVSRIGTTPDGHLYTNISRMRVRKITEVEDEIGNPVSGRVIVDEPRPDVVQYSPPASPTTAKKKKQRNNVKKLLLLAMFESGTTGEGVLVDTADSKRRRKKKATAGMSAEQIAVMDSSSDDEERPLALRDGAGSSSDDEDRVAVTAGQSLVSTREAITNNPMGSEVHRAREQTIRAIDTRNKGANNNNKPRPKHQLHDVFREADRRDRKLATQTFGSESIRAQARLYALAGDTMKLSELNQYDPSWFEDGRSIWEEAKNQDFVGTEAAAVAAAVAAEPKPAQPILRVRVGNDDDDDEELSQAANHKIAVAIGNTGLSSRTASPASGMSHSSVGRTKSRYQSTFIPRVGRTKPAKPTTSQLR